MATVVRPTRYSYRTKSGGIVTRTRKAYIRKPSRRKKR
jgi:hypothetical protein